MPRKLHDHLAAWRLTMRAQGATEKTITTRLYGVQALARRCDPLTASTDDLRQWLADQTSPWTQRTYYVTARAFYAWLTAEGVAHTDPLASIRRVSSPRRVPRPITETDFTTLLASASGNTRTYITLAAFAGLRCSEIARFRGEHVTAEHLRVRGKGGREDVLPTHPQVWAAAREYPRRGWWFPSDRSRSGHVQPDTVSTLLSRLCRDLDVDATAHQIRHLYVTRCYAASGQDILVTQQLARHEDPATTAGYAQVADARLRAAVLGLGR